MLLNKSDNNIRNIFITLPQRDLPSFLPPIGALAVINSLRKAFGIEKGLKKILKSKVERLYQLR